MIFQKPRSLAIIFLVVLATIPLAISTVNAVSNNAIQNPGFESDTDWDARYSVIQGSYAKIQDDDYKYNGTYSGLTETTNPKQECCVASLYQNLDVPVLNVSTFSYRIRKGGSAPNGYYSAEVQIYLSGLYTMHYYHPINPQESPMPSDTDTQKYINVSNLGPRPIFTLVSRDLYADLVGKFGYFIADLNITGIELFSRGFKDLYTGEKFGQAINWDHIYMSPTHPRTQVSSWAVLICGPEPIPENQGAVNAVNKAYTTLQGLGYDHENIYLVSSTPNHDADGDNMSDLDANASVTTVMTSITSWLKGNSDPNDKCFIYAMSHGGINDNFEEPRGYFIVYDGSANYELYDVQIAYWINQVAYGTLTFAIEACYSGAFIDDVSSTDDRIVITSTTDDKGSMNDEIEDEIPCFSYGFFQNISLGGSLGDAFNAGWQRVQVQFGGTQYQYDPWLDDNGDEVGREGIVPHPEDDPPRDGELAIITWL